MKRRKVLGIAKCEDTIYPNIEVCVDTTVQMKEGRESMKLSELIEMLETEKRIHGDIGVHIQATEIDGSGQIAAGYEINKLCMISHVTAGIGYYGAPYEINKLSRTGEMAVCFDKVVFTDD